LIVSHSLRQTAKVSDIQRLSLFRELRRRGFWVGQPSMHLAHHLLRRPSGMWYFRIYIPKDLRPVFGMTILKRSLGTHDPTAARTCAYALGARCAQIFASARIGTRELGMDWDELLRNIQRFEIKAGPDGVSVKTTGTDADNAAALKALQMALDKPLWSAPEEASDAPASLPITVRG
jgi:hypothetical protein